MSDKRRKNINWDVTNDDGRVATWEQVIVAVLMDVRDELQKLNSTFRCPHFQTIPRVLNTIRRNTDKPRKPKGKK